MGLTKRNPYISHWELQYWYFERAILIKVDVIHNVICNFHNTEENLRYGHAINANGNSSTCVYYFSKFQQIIIFQNSTNKIEFHTHRYINITRFVFIFNMRNF